MLEGINVTQYFGSLAAVKELSFIIEEGEIVALIGPNGAGKTTLFNLIHGVYCPTSGRITFMGQNITGLNPYKICRLGIARTHQIVRPFLVMTALENVIVAMLYGAGKSLSNARSEALEFLKFIGLEEKKEILAQNLNLYERKALEIARALATNPQILLLDEVLAGLNPAEIMEAKEVIKRIRDKLGITIFWVEHVMKAIKGTAERVIVMHYGEKIAEGPFEEIVNDKKVIDAYLGEKYMF
ncbi:MAG: ABC transporter ATP-binding protein [Candidatus Hodarchaeota archaeon]